MTTDAPSQPTHYAILALTPALLTTTPKPAALLKQAYHRALLQNHPDKHRAPPPYTIDQISAAYRTLSSPALRAAYDAELRATTTADNEAFRTGVESVDLDDLDCDEEAGTWFRGCRCGNERGFSFGEGDLEGAEREGEVVVGCCDCSLWLRVHFAVVEG